MRGSFLRTVGETGGFYARQWGGRGTWIYTPGTRGGQTDGGANSSMSAGDTLYLRPSAASRCGGWGNENPVGGEGGIGGWSDGGLDVRFCLLYKVCKRRGQRQRKTSPPPSQTRPCCLVPPLFPPRKRKKNIANAIAIAILHRKPQTDLFHAHSRIKPPFKLAVHWTPRTRRGAQGTRERTHRSFARRRALDRYH